MNEVLVSVENLSKKFCKDLKTSLWYGVKDLASGLSGNRNERELRPKEFWAVKDISFELKRGECLGLIGHNGAGKSTLLKILNGLINPDAGKVTIKGRVGALIELGAGFNPILSGRENIYNNGAILGFTRKEIDSKVEEIIDFAEIREFIDMPVQNYSSGMKVRLGFAVAAQMEPDVLIIDEVLAVGDIGFRIKCFNRITELLQGCAVIIVSHSMPQIAKTCTIGLLMEKGEKMVLSYNIGNVIEEYNSKFKSSSSKIISTEVILSKFDLNGENLLSEQENEIMFGNDFILEIEFILEKNLISKDSFFNIIIVISDKELKPIGTTSSNNFKLNENSKSLVTCLEIPKLRFFPSEYSISISLNKFNEETSNQRKTIFFGQHLGKFLIHSGPMIYNHAVLILESNWSINNSQ